MGKAASRRVFRRQKFLAKLAQENPERFESEWAKRVDSWTGLIWATSKDRVYFTDEEYQELLRKFSSVKEELESMSVNLNTGVHIYFEVLSRFSEKLGKEVISEIMTHAKRGTLFGKPIFGIVDHAKQTLSGCGDKAVELQLKETTDLLNNECCRALVPHIGHVIYRLGQYEGFSKLELFSRKKKNLIPQ